LAQAILAQALGVEPVGTPLIIVAVVAISKRL